MIPYFEQPQWELGPFTIRAFAIFLVAAILLGRWLTVRRARRIDLDAAESLSFCRWATFSGIVLALAAGYALSGGKPWAFSSAGALIGGVLAGGAALLVSGLSFRVMLGHIDAAAFVFPWALTVFRAGCSLAHDHPGIASDHWWAVRFPDGPRFDLGLLEMLFALAAGGVFLWIDRRPRRLGFYFSLFLVLYGPFRLWMESLSVAVSGVGISSGLLVGWISTCGGLGLMAWVFGSRRR